MADLAEIVEQERRVGRLRLRLARTDARRARVESEIERRKQEIRDLAERLNQAGRDAVAWGDLAQTPRSIQLWGAERGRCIDRLYIESFLERHAADVRGVVLEVHDDDYTRRFGEGEVTESVVVDIDPTNPRATVAADLCHAPELESSRFDCIVLTQTLLLISEPQQALEECHRILKPGGVLLATLPAVAPVAPEEGLDADFWRFTPALARHLFGQVFPASGLEIEPWGNVLAITAHLSGLVCEDLSEAELLEHDPQRPLIVSVRARRPMEPAPC